MVTKITEEERKQLRGEMLDYFMECLVFRALPAFAIIGFGILIGRAIP